MKYKTSSPQKMYFITFTLFHDTIPHSLFHLRSLPTYDNNFNPFDLLNLFIENQCPILTTPLLSTLMAVHHSNLPPPLVPSAC